LPHKLKKLFDVTILNVFIGRVCKIILNRQLHHH